MVKSSGSTSGRSVLISGFTVMIAMAGMFFAGDRTRLKTEGYGGHPMKVHVHHRRPERVAAWLRDAGFTIETEMLFHAAEPFPGAVIIAR